MKQNQRISNLTMINNARVINRKENARKLRKTGNIKNMGFPCHQFQFLLWLVNLSTEAIYFLKTYTCFSQNKENQPQK